MPDVAFRPFPAGTPEAIAIDLRGRLWVTNYNADVVEIFDVARLASGTARPTGRLVLPQLAGPIGITFDRRGRAWIAEATANAVSVYASAARGRARPVATVKTGLEMPHTVTFGRRGDVWIPCYNDTVVRYARTSQDLPGQRPTAILG
jgi:streptogramin lyase